MRRAGEKSGRSRKNGVRGWTRPGVGATLHDSGGVPPAASVRRGTRWADLHKVAEAANALQQWAYTRFHASLLCLRPRVPAGCPVLRGLRRRARRSTCRRERAAEARDRPLQRRHGVDGARRAARPGVAPGRDGPLLRARPPGGRAARRHGREVHRRCRHGGVRRPGPARGRRAAGGTRRRRAAGRAGRPECDPRT